MNLIVLTSVAFPNGMAPTNRILSYSKGIVELGSYVKVICLKPTEKVSDSVRNTEIKGQINGVEYEYSSGTTIWPEHGSDKIQKLLYIYKGYFKAAQLIKERKKKGKIDAMLLYSNTTLDVLFFFIISKIYNVKYLREKGEYPPIIRKKIFAVNVISFLYVNFIFKLFDGAIIETNKLIEYYRPKFRKKARILRVPMTVDPERFSNINRENKGRQITYCGNMSKPDGVDVLINAFNVIAKKHADVTLVIIGDTLFNKEYEILVKQIKNLELEDRILFTGRLSREEVPVYLCNSTVLALASPLSLRSTGSLPSKLGEYLCTGNPVVITEVGEIPDYLKDNESAFLAKPDSIESFANKLDIALSDVELSKRVGLNGRDVALNNFNYKIQSKKIIDFVNEF
jgi:glycosyltransferase involved in cell wall biosynthesis